MMTVIDNIGTITNEDAAIDSINRFVSTRYLSMFDLEELFKQDNKITFYGDDGVVTDTIEKAYLKIIELPGLVSHRDGWPICVSFVKSVNKAERWGHNSDDAWFGMFAGSHDYLYDRWLKRKDDDPAKKNRLDITQKPIGDIGRILAQPGIAEKLNAIVENSDNHVQPKPTVLHDGFLESVYELLYMKESWLNSSGSLHRLGKYFNYLAIKIFQDDSRTVYMKFNRKHDKVVFNSRLLNKYGNYIIVCCIIDQGTFSHFRVINSVDDLIRLEFEASTLDVPPISFFKSIDEVVFKGTIDDFDRYNLHRLNHVIEERRDRLPKDMQKLSPIDINMKLMASVDMALKVAQTDYKFIVPKYNPEKRSIDFLLPVYTSFDGESKPECALVIDKNEHGKWEIRTVIDIEAAYGNARLINRPDQNWLSIDDISAKPE